MEKTGWVGEWRRLDGWVNGADWVSEWRRLDGWVNGADWMVG